MTQLQALVATIVLEASLVLPVVKGLDWAPHVRWGRLFIIVAAASLLTHPFAWGIITGLKPWVANFWVRALPVELAVALAEGAFYCWMVRLPRRQGLALGVLANAFSFGLGVVWERLG